MSLTYKEFIADILDKRGRFSITSGEYKERHHIIPRCMDGTNDESNLIDLYAKEHYIAHKLLALENPSNSGLQFAWWNMCQIHGNSEQERYEPTPEEFEESRKRCAELSSKNNTGELHPMFGRHHSNKTKERMSKAHKGKLAGAENPMFGKHHDEKWKENNSKMMKERHKQNGHPMSKKVVCDGVVFDNITLCANFYGESRYSISRWIRGVYKMPDKFIRLGLKFYEEGD